MVLALNAVSVSRLLLVVPAGMIHGRADLPQSWHAGAEAQPLISCFELLAQLALLVCRPFTLTVANLGAYHIATEFRQSHRRRSHHEGVFTTADPLRRFVQVTIRWATILPCQA